MPFKNRWRIDGTLTTRTPLHVGSGFPTTRADLVVPDTKNEPILITAVTTGHDQRAYLPGKTLKGVLRAWLDQRGIEPERIEQVFGSAEIGEEITAYGGKVEFGDAFGVAPVVAPSVPHWCDKRLTGVSVSVAIKRQTRTAFPNKLFHQEFVPPGIAFEAVMTGQDLTPAELELLLYALEQFNHPDVPVTLGAGSGDGMGACEWNLRKVSRLDRAGVAAWLQRPDAPVGYSGYEALSVAEQHHLVEQARNAFTPVPPPSLTFSLALHFDGPFLVNDPVQAKSKGDPDHQPRRDHLGRILLPARSIRGAVRSQAERIVRTSQLDSACHVTDPAHACNPIDQVRQRATALCLTCQVFGAPGWSAPVSFSDFVLLEDAPEIPFHQEFLAIDRFTGGGADGLKFNAQAIYQPTLSGTVTIDLKRVDPWALGLLAFVLRDLIEGDISFGFGASKGYGTCRGKVTNLSVTGLDAQPAVWELLNTCEATEIEWNQLDFSTLSPSDEAYTALQLIGMEIVQAFQEQLSTFSRQVA